MKNILKLATTIILGLLFTSISMAGPTVYIALGSANKVIAVDAETDKITATYIGVENPHGLVATSDGEYLIAGSLRETPPGKDDPPNTPNSKLYLIHPAHGHVMSTIPVVGWTHHQAISPDSRFVISTHAMRGYVTVLDLQLNQVVKTIATGPSPNSTLITRDGKYAYVSNSGNNTISKIDLLTWQVTRTLEAGPGPEHIAFSGDESVIFVANPRAGTASSVSVESGKVTSTYTIGKGVHGLDIGDDGRTLFVSSKKGDLLTAIDTRNGTKREINLSPAPYHLNVIKGTGKVYISSRKKPIVWVLDQKTLKITNTIVLPGGEAHQMAVVE